MAEREVKLAVPAAFRPPPPASFPEGLIAAPREPARTRAVYWDAEDLRLIRRGITLRHRTDDGWTLKLPLPGGGAVLERDERVVPGRAGKPPAELLSALTAYLRSAPLREVARFSTIRAVTDVRGSDGGVVAEIADDRVSILDGRSVAGRFREIEIEARDGLSKAALIGLVEVFRSAGAGEPDPTPKLVRALGEAARRPPELFVPQPSAGSTVADVLRAALAASVERLITHDAVVRAGTDPEGVHQARVATRRLRSDLRTFRGFVEPEWAAPLRDELRWLGGALGEVRDADVLLARLEGRADDIPPTAATAVLLQSLADGRDAARDRLLTELSSERYVTLLDRLVEAALHPRLMERAAESARDALPAVLFHAWKRLADHASKLGRASADEALHEARIRTKRARYAAEAIEPVGGKRTRAFAKAAAGLQDVLGEHQDAVVARAWLTESARKASPARAFAAGQLAALEVLAAAESRGRWRSAWKALARLAPA